jgi:fibronectin type III domain protein
MHSGMERLVGLLCVGYVAALLESCQVERPLAPGDDRLPLMAAAASLGAPSNLTATAVALDRVNLGWRDNSTGESGFEVHRSTSGPAGQFTLAVPGRTAANVVSFGDMGRAPATNYCYKVRAFKPAGKQTSYSVFSSAACATTPALPGAPSNANAAPASSSQVMITWKDNSTNEYGFRIERSPNATGPWVSVAFQWADLWFYVDGERVSEQQVCYRVIAYNSAGDSPSNIDCTTPPAAPTDLAAASLEDHSVDLTWADHSLVEDGYQVQRAAGSQSAAFSALAELPANSTSYRDVDVSPNTSYQYRVWAKKDGGPSDLSNIASAGLCVPTGTEEICENGTDDDCDGLIDRDAECATCLWDGCAHGYICDPEGFCVSHCSDGWQNGDEGDVDCGGSCSAKCQSGQSCHGNFDCASNFCVNLICHP